MWPFKMRKEGEEAPPSLNERLAALEVDARSLRRSVDDLDDSFRSFRGRRFKQEARAAADAGETEPALELVAPPSASGAGSVLELKRAGKWPWR